MTCFSRANCAMFSLHVSIAAARPRLVILVITHRNVSRCPASKPAVVLHLSKATESLACVMR
eukprot:3095864-Rhodomonas_salina.3